VLDLYFSANFLSEPVFVGLGLRALGGALGLGLAISFHREFASLRSIAAGF
jgi:hypothetical protein